MDDMESLSNWISAIVLENQDDDLFNKLDSKMQEALKPVRENLKKKSIEIEKLKNKIIKGRKEVEFFKETIDSLPNAIFIKSSDTKFIFFNRKYEEIFGMNRKDLIGKTVRDSIYLKEEDKDRYQDEDIKIIRESSIVHYEMDFLFNDNDTHHCLYWSKGFFVSATGERGSVGEIVDISKKINLEQELSINIKKLEQANEFAKKAYYTDFATGLSNRYVLNERLPELVISSKKDKSPLSLLIADLDDFKKINDTYGHSVGDKVLVAFANVLKKTCRKEDICIRYGGEEFLVLMPNTNVSKATIVGEEICKVIRETKVLDDGNIVTVSIGATQYIDDEHVDYWINRADKALYIKKGSGKNGVVAV